MDEKLLSTTLCLLFLMSSLLMVIKISSFEDSLQKCSFSMFYSKESWLGLIIHP